MANKISYTDSLREGADKINNYLESNEQIAQEAKDTAESTFTTADEAKERSEEAKQTAAEAKTQSINTQNQLDDVIIESGTSDAEVVQSRTNNRGRSFDILKDRLDDLDVEFKERGVNVKWFGASGSILETTGSIEAGSNQLTVANRQDFNVGHGILIKGAGSGGVAEVASLQVTAGATTSGNVLVTLDGIATSVAVLSGDTAIQVADKIRSTSFSRWTTGGTTGTDTVTFTSNDTGTKQDAIYNDNGTGATGVISTTTQGINGADLLTEITAISGTTFTLVDNADADASNSIVKHDDSDAIQNAADDAMVNSRVLFFPPDNFFVSRSINFKKSGRANILVLGAKGAKILKPTGDFAILDFASEVVPATTYGNRIQNVYVEQMLFESADSSGNAIKVRNFGRLFIDDVYAYRFNKSYDIAGGSEAYINKIDWAGGNVGLILNADDGLGGSGAGVDMQVIHISNSQLANGAQGIQLTNAYDVHFHNVELVFGGTRKGLVTDGSTQNLYFNDCHFEWGDNPILELNSFSSLILDKCEFAQTNGTTVSPIQVNNSQMDSVLKVKDSFYEVITNIPLIEVKETSEFVDIVMENNYPIRTNYSVTYEKTENEKSNAPFKLNSFNGFNNEFTKGFIGLNKAGTTVTLTLDSIEKITGSNSVKFDTVNGYWNIMSFAHYGEEPKEGDEVLIDFIIKGTGFGGNVIRGVLVDTVTGATSLEVLQNGPNIAWKVEEYPNGFKRYALSYIVPENKKLEKIRVSNDQNPSVNLYLDYINIMSRKEPIYKVARDTSPPIEGTFASEETISNRGRVAGGYSGWVCVDSGSPGVWKGFGLIEV